MALLQPWFADMARATGDASDTLAGLLGLRRELGRLGREAEAAMLAASGGISTHRGALYSLGFLIASLVVAIGRDPGIKRRQWLLEKRELLDSCSARGFNR